MITVGSLFSGIGGLELGLEMTKGFEVKWQAEKDPFCLKVLEKHWPNVKRYTDVREIDESSEHVDLICGGFPCQPVSCAGKRKGDKDERWMWPEFIRIIRCLRPKWVLVENVPGLLSADSGRLFGGILRDLAESRYDAEWQVLRACEFGLMHRRARVFLVAYDAIKHEKKLPVFCENRNREQRERRGPIEPRGYFRDSHEAETLGWAILDESPMVRGLHGLLKKLDADRIGALGNSVVPQVSQYIGQCILEATCRP